MRIVKNIVRHLLSVACYWLGIDAVFYFLNRRAKRILTFHNVLPDSLLGEKGAIGPIDSFSDFTAIINEVSRYYSFSTDLNDPSSVTITFDDGYRNQYSVAGRWLMQKGIPAVLFVSGNLIDGQPQKALAIDLLSLWVDYAPPSAVKKVFGTFGSQLWVQKVLPRFWSDGESRGQRLLQELDGIFPFSRIFGSLSCEIVDERFAGITANELSDLRQHGWSIGWHTWSHFPLGYLSEQGKKEELDSPLIYRMVAVSYPYGQELAVGRETLQIAQDYSYPGGMSNISSHSNWWGPFFRMRYTLSANKHELHFVLSGCKYFLQSGRLLPRVSEQ